MEEMAETTSQSDETILLVDDDPSVTASLALLLKQAGYRSVSASSPAETLEKVASGRFQLVIQDMNFSRNTTGEEGLQLLGQLKSLRPNMPVILITAWGSIQLAVEGMRAGATDFVTKPWTHQQILQSVRTALGLAAANSARAQDQAVTREEIDSLYDFHDIIGTDARFLKILDIIGRISATDASVLITGESGTGKEMIAEAIHRNSRRKNGPFVKVNLGGISSTLFESEMFGHVKGAFTDARHDRKGRFEIANGGTIFLDEIGDLDPGSQVKMLRVLQDRKYEILGSSITRSVDVRIISATNRNLPEMVQSGGFREDLLYRLNLIAIHLPPLRERPGDIALLVEQFLESMRKVYRRNELTVSGPALRWLRGLPWPGNIRQLRHLIERTVLVSGKDTLEVEDFSLPIEMESSEGRKSSLPDVGKMTLDEIEKAVILKSLKHHGGNITKVAESLGLSRAALYRRFEKYGIQI
ncbi:MAG TPA: sigma-54 dependent transcriptional regulator [Blastocatellia bacterium]|nr:sigma-54 dependent transcriptional regulator [Blastocatellia bacterium]